MTIDCTTNEPAYHTALSLLQASRNILQFYLVPTGKKLIQKGQTFTVTNITQEDAGSYFCTATDKALEQTEILKAELNFVIRKYCRNSFLPRKLLFDNSSAN